MKNSQPSANSNPLPTEAECRAAAEFIDQAGARTNTVVTPEEMAAYLREYKHDLKYDPPALHEFIREEAARGIVRRRRLQAMDRAASAWNWRKFEAGKPVSWDALKPVDDRDRAGWDRYYRAFIAAHGGPVAPEYSWGRGSSLFGQYLERQLYESYRAALASASAAAGQPVDPMKNAADVAAYNATLAGLAGARPLVAGDTKALFDLPWNEQQRRAAAQPKPVAVAPRRRRTAERDAERNAEVARISNLHNAVRAAKDGKAAYDATRQAIAELRARDPALAADCGWKLMAFFKSCDWPEPMIIKGGEAAGLNPARAAHWVRTTLLA